MSDKLDQDKIPDTGISGLYEVVLATDDLGFARSYFSEFGFQVKEEASLNCRSS